MYMRSTFIYTTWHTSFIFCIITNLKIIYFIILFYLNYCILIYTCIYSIIFISMLSIWMRFIMSIILFTKYFTFRTLRFTSMWFFFLTIMFFFMFLFEIRSLMRLVVWGSLIGCFISIVLEEIKRVIKGD